MRTRHGLWATAAALALLALSGCGDATDEGQSSSRSEATPSEPSDNVQDCADVLRHNVQQPDAGAVYRPYETLAQMVAGGRTVDSVVVGTITTRAGRGFDETGEAPTEGAPSSKVVDFDDPAADWRDLEATVQAEQTLLGDAVGSVVVDWTLMGNSDTGEDAQEIGRCLEELGRVLILSWATPTGPEWHGGARVLPDPPCSVATVDPSGRLDFVFAPDAAAFVQDLDTVAKLRRALR